MCGGFLHSSNCNVLLAPDSNKDKDDAGCTVSGGNVSANGIDKFNENAKGGKLEGKGKEIQKIAEKIKYL